MEAKPAQSFRMPLNSPKAAIARTINENKKIPPKLCVIPRTSKYFKARHLLRFRNGLRPANATTVDATKVHPPHYLSEYPCVTLVGPSAEFATDAGVNRND